MNMSSASQYPSLHLAPQWLEECHAFLTQNFNLTAPVLLKKVESQLLLSDLATSTLHHSGLFPANEEQTAVFFESAKGQGVLVQVLEILEIGRPAHELLKLHRDKVEDRKIFSEQGRAVIRAVTDVGPTQDGTGNDTQDPNALGESDSKAFPRAMLRLRVSDGFNEYVAIETKKIRDLNMDETPLGCKLMLKNVRCLRGILMLDETCCIVKGGSLPDLDRDRDALLEDLLVSRIQDSDSAIQHRQASPINRRRAGLPVNARASARGQCQNEGLRAPRPSTISKPRTIQTQAPQAQQQKTRQVDLEADFDLLEDDDDFDEEVLAMLQEAEVAKSASKARGIRTASQNETNAQSSARAVPAASKPARAGSNTSHLDLSRASSSVAGPQPSKAKRTAQVIDLDDSDDEDDDKEVALMLLSSDGPPETGHGRREKHQHRSVSRSGIIQPIEID